MACPNMGSLVLWLVFLQLVFCKCSRVFFEIGAAEQQLGRLTFQLSTLLPQHAENVRLLCSEERVGLDAALTYRGCAFDHSPAYVEGAQYKWGHVLKGRGRNALDRPKEPIRDRESLSACAMPCFGGSYYGLPVGDDDPKMSVVLTVPISGPGSGFTRLSIVRVQESPPSWRQRLLLNSAVIGWLEEGQDTVRAMARARTPPIVLECGVC